MVALWVGLVSAYIVEVAAYTNKEFFELVKPYATGNMIFHFNNSSLYFIVQLQIENNYVR